MNNNIYFDMEIFKYSLAKKGKIICPECRRKTFVLYVDATGEPIHSSVGKCDRSDNCGHHYTPKQYFTDNHISFDNKKEYSVIPKITKPQPSFIDTKLMKKSLTGYDNNMLVKWLSCIVGAEATRKAIDKYHVGTSKNGSTIFWQVDMSGDVRSGKIIQYDSSGHRRKDVLPPVQWVHSVMKLPDFHLSQCLFGEHLLRDATKMVAIVESEKTAIIASIYLPDLIWLACGGSEGLNMDKCQCLKGRRVLLFPDCGMFAKWNEKAKELSKICTVSVSSLIEENATDEERKAGYDIADYCVRFPLNEFLKPAELKNQLSGYQKQPETKILTSTNYTDNECIPCYVDKSGILFIPTPPDCRLQFTVYDSVECYNRRSAIPKIIYANGVDISGMEQVFINLNTLTI